MTREGRHWPAYFLGGRIRTSTVVLIVAFLAVWWLYQEYKPTPEPVQAPASEVVPPGFVPDPNYTWVPRTNVQEPTETTTTTTPTTTETTTPTTSPSPTETTTSESPSTSPTTTPPPPFGVPSPSPSPAAPGPEPSPSPSR